MAVKPLLVPEDKVDAKTALTREAQQAASQQALASISQGVLITGPDRLILFANHAFEVMTGYSQDELLGRSCAILQGPQTSAETILAMCYSLATSQPFTGELLNYRKDGSPFWNDLSIDPVFDPDGQLTHFVGIQRDVTERKAQQMQLKLAAQVVAQGRECITVSDPQWNIVMVNQAFTDVSGYTQAEMLGRNPRILSSDRHDQKFHDTIVETIDIHGEWQGEVWKLRKDGTEYLTRLTISVVRDEEGKVCNYIGTSTDISAQQAAQERINWLSHFDELTGLPNRTLLADRCTRDISAAQRDGRPVAMMVLGLDHFKVVNDSLGHSIGDQVLKQFSQRVSTALRDQDTVARIGGDEFVLVLPGDTPEGAGLLATKLLDVLAQPYQVNDLEIDITTSLGVAMYPSDGMDFETLFTSANVAMHQAKELGRGKHRFFNAEIFERALARVTLTTALRAAIAHNQLQLHYQPFIDMQTGQIGGMEALLRWTHPELGAVSPAHFIPIAEQSGLIFEIGVWVFQRVCHDIQDWLSRGIEVPQVSVNLSPVEFRDVALLQHIKATLAQFAIDPHRICMEVTEGALMEDVKHSNMVLQSLKALGVKLALDDFGTGYSSLSYLKLFPFDKVKIDQSFVRDIGKNTQDEVIAKVVISMAHGLGLRVIAEGVETEAQCAFMRMNTCDEIQGYFFSRPVPKSAIEAMLIADERLPAHLIRAQTQVKTLLLVDDELNDLATLSRLLRPDGYQILTAASGSEGLELLAKSQIDLIVSDQHMPGMSGVEFLQHAKALYPDTMRIVLSGYTDLQPVTDAVKEGTVYRVLIKPWDDNQLRNFIKEAFSHKELSAENQKLNLKIRAANQALAISKQQLQDILDHKQRQLTFV
jgi:diguanylate cyclase (GGDEF)-like protein/PAS domain S-box-containing protein